MALRGRIENFGLADILQIIATGNKSGVVTLEHDIDEVQLTIKDGWVVTAGPKHRPIDASLGTRLAEAGLLSRSQLGAALKRRAETDQSIGNIIVDLGFLKPEIIKQYATLLVTDVIYELFTWDFGTYEFEETEVELVPVWNDPISIESLLMSGIPLIEEWPEICRKISSYKLIVDRRERLPKEQELDELALFMGTAEHPEDSHPELGTSERIIHQLCLPGTSVQTIIDRAPLNRFETCRCLATLLNSGFLRLVEED